MQTIKEIIEKVLGDLKNSEDTQQNEIKKLLKKQLTEKEFQHINYISLRKENTLFIGVDSQIWLAQLNLKKETILENLKEKIKLNQIKFFLKKDE